MTLYPTYSQVFQLLKDAVVLHPTLETFATLRTIGEFRAENLAKNILYKDSPYFYSKEWTKRGYDPSQVAYKLPALLAIPISVAPSKDKQDLLNIELSVVMELTDTKESVSLSKYYCDMLPEDLDGEAYTILSMLAEYLYKPTRS